MRMMTNLVDKKCESIEWYTPERVLGPVSAYYKSLGLPGIMCDPATSESNPTSADTFFTVKEDGLSQEWGDNSFLNPPYGKVMKDWLAKLRDTTENSKTVIALLPASRWEQEYFQRCVFNEALDGFVLIRKRLQFLRSDGTPCKGNPYASVLYGYNIQKWRVFERCMSEIGTVIKVADVEWCKDFV